MNSFGQKLKEGKCKSGNYINISNQSSGFYYLQFMSEGNQQIIKKITTY
jgi:hypothetical protein